MTLFRRGSRVVVSLAVCAAAASGCGKKGPPLPPLARIPAAPGNAQAARIGDEVYVWVIVPSANVSGQTPADVSSIDLYAVTALQPPAGADLTEQAVKVASYPVHAPVPPLPPTPEGAPPRLPPAPPGFVQGATAVVREALTADNRRADRLPAAGAATAREETAPPPAGPLVPPADFAVLKRYYFLVAVSPAGRTSAPTPVLSVPLGDVSRPPTNLRIEYTESSITLKWAPSANAHVTAAAVEDPTLLPARPIVPPPAPTGYHVFTAGRDAVPLADPFSLTLPSALTPQPLATTEYTIPGAVQFGQERCFVVRAADMVGGVLTIGDASEPACVTPVDTFPPAPPTQLAAIAGAGVINLIWEANTEADLAGYIVLRGIAPGDTLQALTPAPIRETTYRDLSVTPGVRYTYAVVAVDNASPQNVSGQSNRVEESSRTP